MRRPRWHRVTVGAAVGLVLLACSSAPAFAVPPSNDDFDSAKVIGALPYADPVNTVDATSAGDDPSPCRFSGHSIWYRFAAAANARIELSRSGTADRWLSYVFTLAREERLPRRPRRLPHALRRSRRNDVSTSWSPASPGAPSPSRRACLRRRPQTMISTAPLRSAHSLHRGCRPVRRDSRAGRPVLSGDLVFNRPQRLVLLRGACRRSHRRQDHQQSVQTAFADCIFTGSRGALVPVQSTRRGQGHHRFNAVAGTTYFVLVAHSQFSSTFDSSR